MIQVEIAEWHRATFGSERIIDRLILKLREEIKELNLDLDARSDSAREEMADVAIVLYAMADRLDFDLDTLIRGKLARVKARDQVARDAERGITLDVLDSPGRGWGKA